MDFMPNVMMAVAGGSAWVFAYLIASQTSASGYGPEQCLGVIGFLIFSKNYQSQKGKYCSNIKIHHLYLLKCIYKRVSII